MKKKHEENSFGWSYLIKAEDIEKTPFRMSLSADQAARDSLVTFFDLISMESFTADISVSREHGGFLLHVKGTLCADIVQSCVVSGEPVPVRIEEPFEAFYSDPKQAVSFAKAKNEIYVSYGFIETPVLNEKEDPEPIVNGQIDVADLACQYLSLSIDPYPHAPDIKYEKGDDEPRATPSHIRQNPFQALKALKERPKDKQEKK